MLTRMVGEILRLCGGVKLRMYDHSYRNAGW